MRKVQVMASNETWPASLEAAFGEIQYSLGKHCLAVHHIGSTL
ncbi:GrpB family protein [Planococcus sp. ISL-109]|nr:GrpB family protein [Planococcus sp. ISL-109]